MSIIALFESLKCQMCVYVFYCMDYEVERIYVYSISLVTWNKRYSVIICSTVMSIVVVRIQPTHVIEGNDWAGYERVKP